MKSVIWIFLIISTLTCSAQPTGHQRIFLEVTDANDTIHFEKMFKKNQFRNYTKLNYKNYQLIDLSKSLTGFSLHGQFGYIYKTLFSDDHQFHIVRNGTDIMQIEILNAFNVYFLSIPFQKGNFKMYVNDAKENSWNFNTLPYKQLNANEQIYDITPQDWSVFEVRSDRSEQDYFISKQFEKQHLLVTPVLPENDPNFRNPRRINTLKIELADYNFDGQLDYREHKWNNSKSWNYFVYKDSVSGYVLDSLMSSLDITYFDFEKKIFTVKNSNSKHADINALDTYEFLSGKPTRIRNIQPQSVAQNELPKIEEPRIASTQTYDRQPFQFVFKKNISGIEIPAEKGFYANQISVYDIATHKLIFETIAVGNSSKESIGCSDSLQIADFNFDNYPDFRICNNSVGGKQTYYIYHPKRKIYIIEKTLSELNNLSFDFIQKTAHGQTERKESIDYPRFNQYQYYKESLTFEGVSLENLTVTTSISGVSTDMSAKCKYINQKRIYEGDTSALKMQKNNLLTKVVGQFLFQIEFNPEEVKTGDDRGSYVKVINIFEGQKEVGHFVVHGKYTRELPHWLDSIEIADFNFDNYPDIRMYNSIKANGSYIYLLFNPDEEVRHYYEDALLSSAIETDFIPKRKIWKGKIVESNLTRYLFLKNDTLTITIQENDLSKPPFIEESVYKNGTRKGIRSAYRTLEPVIKKEYGDYNFDGYEDFRQENKTGTNQWNVYIYNALDKSFVIDTLLSKFDYFEYSALDKKLLGYYTVRMNETTNGTYYYNWSYTDNKMVLYQVRTCVADFPMSESSQCVTSTWKDGKWVETIELGAE